MDIEPTATSVSRVSPRIGVIGEIAFGFFLLLVFVGLEPFAGRDIEAIRELASGEGDLARQLTYLLAFAFVAALSLWSRGLAGVTAFPPAILVVLLWLLLSAAWSVAPEITIRRAGLTALIVATICLSVDMLGTERSLRVLYGVLASILIVNLLSVFIVPQAVHLPDEIDAALIGNWRGLYPHKNTAGLVTALSAFLFLHYALQRSSRHDWILFLGAVVFTLGTHSKTATGLLVIVLLASLFYRFASRNPAWRRAFLGAFFAFLFLTFMSIFLFIDYIAAWLNNPEILTGRGAIWLIVMDSIGQHPFFGVGFGAFWKSGLISPAINLAMESWVMSMNQSHNGYLEILLTTGIVGLLLTLIAIVVIPLHRLLSFNTSHAQIGFLLFSWIVFCLLLNLTETRLFERDRPEWVILTLALAILHQKPQIIKWIHGS